MISRNPGPLFSPALRSDARSTSVQAATKVVPKVKGQRAAVLAAIISAGSRGAIDEEIGAAIGLDGNSVRPRRGELLALKLIHDSGTRTNSGGNKCVVWIAGEGV